MTDLYAVIGNPIAQSKSPLLHTAFARQLGHDLRYEAILAEPAAFRETVLAFAAAGGRGRGRDAAAGEGARGGALPRAVRTPG